MINSNKTISIKDSIYSQDSIDSQDFNINGNLIESLGSIDMDIHKPICSKNLSWVIVP